MCPRRQSPHFEEWRYGNLARIRPRDFSWPREAIQRVTAFPREVSMRLRALLKILPRRVTRGDAITAALVVVAVIAATAVPAGQTKTSQNGQTGSIPRMASGHPDLQGVWNFSTLTPLERPAEFAGKAVFSEKEAADYERSLLGALDHDTREGAERACKGTGNYNEFWYDRGSS